MSKDILQKWIAIYGSDTRSWPAVTLNEFDQLLHDKPELYVILDAELAFNQNLRQCFDMAPSPDFVSLITHMAFTQEQKIGNSNVMSGLKRYLVEIMEELYLPGPVVTFASIMLLGVILGFAASDEAQEDSYIIPDISTTIYETRGVL